MPPDGSLARPVILFPAIDLKDGSCVRLQLGEMDRATVFNDDPAAQARTFEEQGFRYLHIVDLNGAFAGKPVNESAVEAILDAISIPAQLGGGIRDMATIETWIDKGIARVILGTVAVRDPGLVLRACSEFPGRIAVGIDAKGGKVAVEGWAETSELTAIELARRFEDAGGVGGFAIQLASYAGATVITTCSPRNIEYVQELGATYAIDYHTEDVTARALAITGGRGVDAVVDVIGRESATAALDLLAFGGGLACVESLPDFRRWRMFDKGLSVHEIALGGAYASGDRRAQEELARMAEELVALVAAGDIDPMVTEVIALEEIPAALERLAGRHTRGKIVAQIGS